MNSSIELYVLEQLREQLLRLDAVTKVNVAEEQVNLYNYIFSQMLDNIDELQQQITTKILEKEED